MFKATFLLRGLFLLLQTLWSSGEFVLSDECDEFDSGTKVINLGAMFPLNGSWNGGVSCLPAAMLALAHVNCHPTRSLVDGYKLKLQVTNTLCEPGKGVKDLYDFLYESAPNTPSAILGPGCSSVSTAVAEAAHLWNVLMVSYGSSSPALSDRKRFPTFFRTHPSGLIHNPTRINLFTKFGWKKVFLLVRLEEVFTTTADHLTSLCKKNNITVTRSTFQSHPKNAIQALKRQDARIIVGLFYETAAREVFCEAYKAGLYGNKIVWFILGWFPDTWYHPVFGENLPCTGEEMQLAADGHFSTEIMQLGSEDLPTFSGITPLRFQNKLLQRLGDSGKNSGGFPESPLAYDAVWALAIAINSTIIELMNQGYKIAEEFRAVPDVTVISERAFFLMKSYLDGTNFIGVSGNVSFTAGDRVSSVSIEFMKNGTYYDYGSHTENYNVVKVQALHDFWPFNEKYQAPRDGIEISKELQKLKAPVFFTFSAFAFLGILTSLGLLLFNGCFFRRARVVFNSQPLMNNIMLVGCILTLFCVFLSGLTGELETIIESNNLCQVVLWMMSLGFTLGFGSLFAKVWALHVVATKMKPSRMSALSMGYSKNRTSTTNGASAGVASPTASREKAGGRCKQITRASKSSCDPLSNQSPVSGAFDGEAKQPEMSKTHLYACLCLLLVVELAFLSVHSSVAPLTLQTEVLETRNATTDGEVRVMPYIYHCRSKDHNLWTGLNFGYKGCLLLLAALFAYDSRNVQLENMNDARQVSMAVYNIVTLYWITVPVTMLIKAHQDASYVFASLATVLSVFVTQGLVFGPKIRAVLDNNNTVAEERSGERANSVVNHISVASSGKSSSRLAAKESLRRRQQTAASRNRADELERYNELYEENERVKAQIVQWEDYLNKLKDKYEELCKDKLESTLRKRAPPGRVPMQEIDFFTEFLYIDSEDIDQISVSEV